MWQLFFQVETFVLTLLVGLITGMVFQYYQCVMAQSAIGRYFLYCLDFLVWVLMVVFVFSLLLVINQGEIRVYILLALLLGIFAYFRYLASSMKDAVRKAAYLTVRLASFFKGLLAYPAGWVKRQIAVLHERFSKPDDNDDIEE